MFTNCFIILASFAVVESAKILVVVPTTSISHQIVFRPIIKELINRDHEVVVITPNPIFPLGNSPENLKEIDVHDLSYSFWHKVCNEFTKNSQKYSMSVMKLAFTATFEVFQKQLKSKSVSEIIRNKTMKFDVMILEESVTPTLIFSHIFEAPVIYMSSLGVSRNMNVFGATAHPLLYPSHFQHRIYNLTWWEKISQLYNHITFNEMLENLETFESRMLQRLFGTDTPALHYLKRNVGMMFLNIHPVWSHNQPVPSSVIYTWGIHKIPEKKLSKDIQTYLDLSKNDVIYVSFGTNFNTSSIHPETLEIFLKVFSQLPYNILWKWDLDELPDKSENIKICKWFPQVAVLRHPKVKLFITQGGLQSIEEAMNAVVPLIGFPLFADQAYNTEKFTHFNIGIRLDFETLTVEIFVNAIMSILRNYDSYQKNIIHLRTQMLDQPKPALENAIWWIEYVLRHGGAQHLRTPASNMSWTEYYELVLVVIVLIGLIVLGAILLLILYSCFKRVCLLRFHLRCRWRSKRMIRF